MIEPTRVVVMPRCQMNDEERAAADQAHADAIAKLPEILGGTAKPAISQAEAAAERTTE